METCRVVGVRTVGSLCDVKRGSPAVDGDPAGVDHVGVAAYGKRAEVEIAKLSVELREGTYRPQPLKRVTIDKPGSAEKRPLGIPTVRDRVAHGAVKQVVEPIFEAEFAANSYGFRPGLGCKDALREAQRLLDEGRMHVVDVDIKSFFDTIDHELLMKQVEERIADGKLLNLIRLFLKQGVQDELKSWETEEGTPQGGVISPLLANIYLNPLDWLRPVTKRCNGFCLNEIIRRINVRLRGWFEYFKHAYRTTFTEVDGWVRMRLRSILRKRCKRKGRGRGSDHQRWPNAFFTEHGLFSCVTARAELVNPCKR